jgi:hypothetical protein
MLKSRPRSLCERQNEIIVDCGKYLYLSAFYQSPKADWTIPYSHATHEGVCGITAYLSRIAATIDEIKKFLQSTATT